MKEQDTFNELMLRYRGLPFTLCSRYKHRGLEVNDLIQEATIAGSEVDSKARVKSTSDLNNTDWTAAITFVLPPSMSTATPTLSTSPWSTTAPNKTNETNNR